MNIYHYFQEFNVGWNKTFINKGRDGILSGLGVGNINRIRQDKILLTNRGIVLTEVGDGTKTTKIGDTVSLLEAIFRIQNFLVASLHRNNTVWGLVREKDDEVLNNGLASLVSSEKNDTNGKEGRVSVGVENISASWVHVLHIGFLLLVQDTFRFGVASV